MKKTQEYFFVAYKITPSYHTGSYTRIFATCMSPKELYAKLKETIYPDSELELIV